MQLRVWALIAILFALPWLAASSAGAQSSTGWPLSPSDGDHPIGNSFGEFQGTMNPYFHAGIDILLKPKFGTDKMTDDSAHYVFATVGGNVIAHKPDGVSTNGKKLTIIGEDGTTYKYLHVANKEVQASALNASMNGMTIPAGEILGRIADWGSCGYHHTHYEIERGGNLFNPLAEIGANPDHIPPTIEFIGFAGDDNDLPDVHAAWDVQDSVNSEGCTLVSGNVDIVVQARDQDNAYYKVTGSKTVGIKRLEWRACAETEPDCDWQESFVMNHMPSSWQKANDPARAYYSVRDNWKSNSSYCEEDTWHYYIVTNYSAETGRPTIRGNWDTNTGMTPNGTYTVSVKATDFAGNHTIAKKEVCVNN